MSIASRRLLSKMISFFVVTVFLISQNMVCGYLHAAEVTATTKVKHKAVEYFVPGKRIVLNADITDKEGIELVRCYFRSQGEADFVFVAMSDAGSGTYNATLPAPSESTQSLDYLFLVVNSEKQVVKTQTFTVPKKEDDDTPAWQQVSSDGDIVVNTELSSAPSQLAGFSDSIVIDVVESSARFGVVAGGLYAAGSSTTAGTTAATSAGTITTITASSGISTAAIIGAGVAVAAVGAVAAVAANNSDDDDGGGSSSTELTEDTIVGTWDVYGTYSSGESTTEGSITFNENESYSYSLKTTYSDDSTEDSSGTGTWSLSGTDLTLTFDQGAIYSGTVSGNATAFTMDSSNGWKLDFSR